jgi:hypothetical protein
VGLHELRRLRGPLLALLSITLVLGVVEGWARDRPLPRIQQVYDDSQSFLLEQDGEPYWVPRSPKMDHRNLDCPTAGAPTAVLVGDSILYGVRTPADRALGVRLQTLWREATGADQACVVNLSQPGYAFQNQLAAARAHVPALVPQVVLWEIWDNGINRFERLGDAVYNFGRLAPTGGVPSPFGLSDGLNRSLFVTSGLYRQLLLGAAKPVPGVSHRSRWAELVDTDLAAAHALVQDAGAELVLVYCPPLNAPLAETADNPPDHYAPIRSWASEHKVRSIVLADALRDHDVADIRLDECCHFNEHGQALVAEALLPVLVD